MSVTRHHAEWLYLIEVSGPFLSMPVLMRIFPQGLDPREPEKARELRLAYEEWVEKPNAPGRHQSWVRFVLTRFLEFPENLLLERQSIPYGIEAHMAEYGEILRPDYAIIAPPGHVTAGKPHLLLQVYPPGQNLDGPVSGKHWKASPATRMTELLHAVDIPTGIITNGEQWMLVYAPRGETSGYASWDAGIWQEEPITLRAFSSVMHVRRFFGVAESDTLTALLKESAQDQQEVTDQLGLQVRRSVEVLVQAFDRLDQESGRQLLHDIEPKELYDAALTVMMRMVFLFSAEERGMLRLGEPLYDDNYAASTLREQLREAADQHGEEVLERRSDAWSRLLATFRAVYGGIAHETLRLPAYRGTLFDPDRYPFLEGRPAGTDWRRTTTEPLAVNNRVVLHLLESLQLLQMKVPGGGPSETRRLSFRALDIEQIGHVYEGLLDHTAVRATTTILGLQGTKNSEPEIPLEKLEKLRAEGEFPLIEYLKEETKRSEPALRRALTEKDQITIDNHKIVIACSQDVRQHDRIRPFARLLRMDSFDMPVVVLPGSVYVTEGTTRRSTGTHYTPKSLTEPIVQHTLEPLVYEGPAEGWPKEKWKLKSPREILALRVCDMTMGSGAFLVQSCRYLAERLAEAWENTEQASPGSFVVTPDGELSVGGAAERLLPKDPDERLIIARRAIADRCLYGVDINPMAVEMAKLSLWLVTMQKNRPFTFLDHALKCGDSLLGITSVEQLEDFSLRLGSAKQMGFSTLILRRNIDEAKKKREALEAMPSNTSEQIAVKSALYAEAEEAVTKLNAAADVLMALELKGLKGRAYDAEREASAEHIMAFWVGEIEELKDYARERLAGRHCLHWTLAFPEIMDTGGFDAYIGNPPYMGSSKLTGCFGSEYREYLVNHVADGVRGPADLCVYFLLRIAQLLKTQGFLGLVVTSAVAEGDNREVGLDCLLKRSTIIRANPTQPWPGSASVFFSALWISKQPWSHKVFLNNVEVRSINSQLLLSSNASGKPHSLKGSSNICYQGCVILGTGFVLNAKDACALIQKNPKNRTVIHPYLTGKDLNEQPGGFPVQFVINFRDWPLSRSSAPYGYSGPVAEDFPDCLDIVREMVKPVRDKDNRKVRRERWWQFAERSTGLYDAVQKSTRALAIAKQATKYVTFEFVEGASVFSHALAVVASNSFGMFAVLNSSFHEVWAREFCSYNLLLMRYSPSDLFSTFPFPVKSELLERSGKEYQQYRYQLMLSSHQGLTGIYNRYHDLGNDSTEIAELRRLHIKMDQAVAAAYNWTDLDLGHGFHNTNQGIRFAMSEAAQRIVMERLLALNHEKYEEEVKVGLHEKNASKGAGKGRKKKSPPEERKNQYEIFEE